MSQGCLQTLPAASAASSETRAAIAAWRQALGSGEVSLAEVLVERPDCFSDWSVIDLLRLGRSWGRHRVATLNGHAVACGVNLVEQVGEASPETIAFALQAVDTAGQTPWVRAFAEQARAHMRSRNLAPVRKAQREAKALRRAITAHRRAIEDPELDADVAEADAKLWEAGGA